MPVYVPHPIQDQLPVEIENRADAVVTRIVARLTRDSASAAGAD